MQLHTSSNSTSSIYRFSEGKRDICTLHMIILVSSTRPQVIEQSLKLEVISVQSIRQCSRQVVAAQISLFKIVPSGGKTGITENVFEGRVDARICLSKKTIMLEIQTIHKTMRLYDKKMYLYINFRK